MAGNSKTPRSVAIKSAQMKPGSKGVMVGKNAGKATVQSSAPKSSGIPKKRMGGKC